MTINKWFIVIIVGILMTLPAAITGCGVDDTNSTGKVGKYTMGPGNQELFPASHTAW